MAGLACAQRPVSYAGRLDKRSPGSIKTVVVHCTELPDLAMAREYAERIHYAASQTGNCGHFYLDRGGQAEQWVPLDRVAHHVRGHNQGSIGIELVNTGRYPHWLHSGHQQMAEPYPEAQLVALLELLAQLRLQLPALSFIAGHDQLDREQVPASDQPGTLVQRKTDPGPLFPWPRIIASSSLQPIPA
jgi:N-acetylmuramoyl-L-alanine amidase